MAEKKQYKTARERMMEKARLGPLEDAEAASGMEANPPPPVPKTAEEVLALARATTETNLSACNQRIAQMLDELNGLRIEKGQLEYSLSLLTIPTVASDKEKGETFDKKWDLVRQIEYVLRRHGPISSRDIRSYLHELTGIEYSGQKIGQTLATNPWCFRRTGETALVGAGAIWEYSRDDSRGD